MPKSTTTDTSGSAADGAAGETRAIEKLSQEQIDERLGALPEWSQSGETLQRTFAFKDFVGAMQFVNRVADVAERQDHHPDILVRYNKVTLTLATHDAGGITARDFELARACDGLHAA